jgi:Ca-activated chloride channel family protein
MRPALLLLFLCLQALPDVAQSRRISGVVLDGRTVDLLGGVRVGRDTGKTETDGNGKFTVSAPEGEVSLDFEREGYQTAHQTLLPGQDFVTVFLQPQPALAGTKADMDSAGEGPMPVSVTALENETYQQITDNPFEDAGIFPFSSFALNANRVSFCNVRRFLTAEMLPPPEAVRVGEMVNYPARESPADTAFFGRMGLDAQVVGCPWSRDHWLLALTAVTRKMPADTFCANNLVLLIDISGSMSAPNKLPLLKKAFDVLADRLTASDRISVIVYSGSANVVLSAVPGNHRAEIKGVINNLSAGGTTAGTAGIETAFRVAKRGFIPGGNNRVIMATDGDFNVGESSDAAMQKLISRYHGSGIYLTCIGVGTGNYKDSKLETLARWGQGDFIYLDDLAEAARVFAGDSFFRILAASVADASLAAVFNPGMVKSYRLVGYEPGVYGDGSGHGRLPGGELGYGQQLTAFYELSPAPHLLARSGPMATVVLKYHDIPGGKAHLLVRNVAAEAADFRKAPQDLQLRAGLALFAMLLRDSRYRGSGSYRTVEKIIAHLKEKPYRQQNKALLKLVQKAHRLSEGER